MQGDTQREDLEKSHAEVDEIAQRLEKIYDHKVKFKEPENKYATDRTDILSGYTWEMKSDPKLGLSGRFMLELFAGFFPSYREPGWMQRYTNGPTFLVYYSNTKIFIYDFALIFNYFWSNIKKIETFGGLAPEWEIKVGVRRNPFGFLVFWSFDLAKKFQVGEFNRYG